MSSPGGDPSCLFADIERFLSAHCAWNAGVAFWRERPYLTRAEIALLGDLADTPHCVDMLAARLAITACDAGKLANGLVAIGLLETMGNRFTASPAAVSYCRALANGAI